MPGRSAEPNPQYQTSVPEATFSTTQGEDYVFSVWGVGSLGDWGRASSFLLEGTDLRLRDAARSPVGGQTFAVNGRALTTFDDAPIAGTTVIVQRKLRTGSTYRSLGVSDVTGRRGWFSIEFTPRRGVSYRVALVGQEGLGASLAAIPAVVR
jgi:hypothetical protein